MPVTFVVIGNEQRLLPVTNIVAQVTGTNRLVTGFFLMLVTIVVLVTGKDCCPLPILWPRSLVPADW
jgi:hypothetical protein